VSRRALPLLLALFAASGCAALIYEVVWLQLLQLVIGSSAVSMGVLLGTYMGGMCLGSIAMPRMVSARRHPLRVYALIEAGLGIFGIVVLLGVPQVGRLYGAIGLPGFLLRGAVSAVCLLPPTVLMGASLPAIARWVRATPRGVSRLGLLYGANIAGAVFGCLLAGFYLLRFHDMAVATYAAAALNGMVALVAAVWAMQAPAAGAVRRQVLPPRGSWPVYTAIALSGLCALGAEVVWTRLLSLLLGATVYTFSIILAVFLIGLGIGSGAGSFLARRVTPRIALGFCQAIAAAAVAWAAFMIVNSLPHWHISAAHFQNRGFRFGFDLLRGAWAILPAALLWGASFPLALAAAASRRQDPSRLVGGIYAANTAGAIVGAIGFSMVLIPWLGTRQSERVLMGLAALAALVVLGRLRSVRAGVALVVSIGLLVWLGWRVPPVPWMMIAYGRRMTTETAPGKPLYVHEGMNSSIAVSEPGDGQRYFHVSGKVEATTESFDMRLQRMLGHIPALLHSNPQSVLVVGFGAGVTAGSFVLYPEVRRIVICEIEPAIPPATSRYFGAENYDVLRDPRTTVVYDDARHYVLTTRDKFDIITSDPIHPWVKGTSTLYSAEYFEMCKRHLNPGGLIAQWVPLYESDLETVKSELATFFRVFPNGTIWGNDNGGEGYDIVLLAQAGPATIDVDALEQRLHGPVQKSMRDVGFWSAVGILSTYAGRGSDLAPWLAHAQINNDLNLRLQYLAGMGLDSYNAPGIYAEMLGVRRFPEGLFTGSAGRLAELRSALGAQ
jgi:spermidine synthase